MLKFQPMYCTVQCISRQQLACYGCVALISVFFLNAPRKSVERLTVEWEVAALITVTVLILKTTKQ